MNIRVVISAENPDDYRKALAALCEGVIGPTPEHPLVEAPVEEPVQEPEPPKRKRTRKKKAETPAEEAPVGTTPSVLQVPEPEPEPEPDLNAADNAILDVMRSEIIQSLHSIYVKEAGKKFVHELLSDFGVSNFQDLPDEKVSDFHAKVTEFVNANPA